MSRAQTTGGCLMFPFAGISNVAMGVLPVQCVISQQRAYNEGRDHIQGAEIVLRSKAVEIGGPRVGMYVSQRFEICSCC